MLRVCRAIKDGKVACLKGVANPVYLKDHLLTEFRTQTFSDLNFDIQQVEACLTCRRFDFQKSLIVFYRCDAWARKIAPFVRKRRKGQAVLWITDGAYSAESKLICSMSEVVVNIGQTPSSLFSTLRKPHGNSTRLSEAAEHASIAQVMEQVHESNDYSLELTDTLGDADLLMHRVPQDMVLSCLPPMSAIQYRSTKQRSTDIKSKINFMDKVLGMVVARERGNLVPYVDVLEYSHWAHRIHVRPDLCNYPRDDDNLQVVNNVNDKIRALTWRPHRAHEKSTLS